MTARDTRIEWHGVPRSEEAEALIRQQAARIAAAYSGVWVRRVTLESTDPKGSLRGAVCASVEVRGPERQILVNREHEQAVAALRQAFDVVFGAFDRRHRGGRRTSDAERYVLAA